MGKPYCFCAKCTATNEATDRRPIPSKQYSHLSAYTKIDEIYKRLKECHIYSTFDFRSGFYHMALSEETKAKSTFVTPHDKFEFIKCIFGLVHTSAYFQKLTYEVLRGSEFAFGYSDIVVFFFSQDVETHIKHF